uniref:Cx9C motif-containing protein 4, mitochondrial n=1 Tax=Hyaloperonospora arabidopsidis (strain Emoy2) TaxID=559515 RepID=M4B4Z9_HYAAE
MTFEKALCERVCKKQACAIQFCLQRHGYQESKCAAVIKQYYDCCAAATKAEKKLLQDPGRVVAADD